jgi:glycine betaine catabolism B
VDAPLCFIAAGSGVTPFRSMIKYALDTDLAVESWLLHSAKTQKDLIFSSEFSEWSGSGRRFHYVPTLTQDFDDNWKNETGRISDALIRKHITTSPCTFLLCGPPAFVGDMEKLLKGPLEVPTTHIRREQW